MIQNVDVVDVVDIGHPIYRKTPPAALDYLIHNVHNVHISFSFIFCLRHRGAESWVG